MLYPLSYEGSPARLRGDDLVTTPSRHPFKAVDAGGTTLSEVVADLVRRGLGQSGTVEYGRSANTGLPTARTGRIVTQDDARSLGKVPVVEIENGPDSDHSGGVLAFHDRGLVIG